MKKVDSKLEKELLSLLEGMDLPVHRRKLDSNYDAGWLNRNIPVRNSEHKNFGRAMSLLKKIL